MALIWHEKDTRLSVEHWGAKLQHNTLKMGKLNYPFNTFSPTSLYYEYI